MACIAKRRRRYVIDYYDNIGKRQRKTLKAGTTKKKAKEKLREIEDLLSKGIYIPDNKIPLFSKAAEEWLYHKKSNIRYSTWTVYEGHTKNHFSEFDELRIDRITTAKIEKFITNRQKEKLEVLPLVEELQQKMLKQTYLS